MNLSDWLKIDWLVEHKSSDKEISNLLGLIDRDLAECRKAGLSLDWRFNIAYNSALQCATTALYASGFRPARGDHHYRTIQSLEFTILAERKSINQLDAFRKKRIVCTYDAVGSVSETELDEMIELARQLRESVVMWLKKNHPEFLTP